MDPARKCPICDGNRGKTVRRRERDGRPGEFWTLTRCSTCGMVYLAQQIDYETQSREFDWADTFAAERRRRRDCQPNAETALSKAQTEETVGDKLDEKASLGRRLRRLRKRFRRDRSLKTMAVVYRYKLDGRLCDFGCGTGKLLVHAVERFEAYGVDISQRQADAARRRVPDATIVVCPACKVDLPRETFDVVTMQSYIEHEFNPLAALRSAWGLLKPGGILVIKTPNHSSWNRIIHGGRWCGYRFPDHCNYFTMRTLFMAAALAGFQPLPGLPGDRLPLSDNMYLAAVKPIPEKCNPAELAGQRSRCSAELSHLSG